MFPVYITSKNVGFKHVVLWQLNDYMYEIEFTANELPPIALNNTSYEDALERFNKTEVNQ